jgi:hypothetical protein
MLIFADAGTDGTERVVLRDLLERESSVWPVERVYD